MIWLRCDFFSYCKRHFAKFNYIFHTRHSVYSSLLNLSMANPVVSTICYLCFFITISIFSLPLSLLLTFLCINIPLLESFWSSIVCQSDEDVSRKLMINLAIITNCTQTMVLLFSPSIRPHPIFHEDLFTESQ